MNYSPCIESSPFLQALITDFIAWAYQENKSGKHHPPLISHFNFEGFMCEYFLRNNSIGVLRSHRKTLIIALNITTERVAGFADEWSVPRAFF